MRIQVLYFAMLRDLCGCSEETIEVESGATIAHLSECLMEKFPPLSGHMNSIAWGLNFEYARLDAVLQEGDRVALLPPVSGGTDD